MTATVKPTTGYVRCNISEIPRGIRWKMIPTSGPWTKYMTTAWAAELDATNQINKTAAEAQAATADAEKAAAVEKAAADKAAWREKHGLAVGECGYKIEQGCLAEVPIWESHKRGKNWFAVISLNPSSPGGLDRDFTEKAKGDLFYHLPTMVAGDAIEFGADYYSGGGSKSAKAAIKAGQKLVKVVA